MTSSDVICGRPYDCNYCIPAYFALGYMEEYGREKGFIIDDVSRYQCKKDTIYEHIEQYDPQFFFGIGHGNKPRYTGNNTQDIWNVGVGRPLLPPENLRNRIVYLWSCLTGVELGPSIVNDYGGKTYFGFTVSWGFHGGSNPGDPYKHRYDKCFFQSGNELIKALFDGCSAQEAYQRSFDKYTEWIDYWLYGEGSNDSQASSVSAILIRDRNGLVIIGDKNARLDRGCQKYDEPDCRTNNCFWYNDSCHNMPPTCEKIYNEKDCYDYDCYWYRNSCHSEPLPPDHKINFTIEADIPKMDAINFVPTSVVIQRTESNPAHIEFKNNSYPGDKAYCSVYILDTDKELYFWNGYINTNETISDDVTLAPPGEDHPWGNNMLRMEVGYLVGDERYPQDMIDKPVFILQ